MARIPYGDPEAPEARALVERIVAERGSLLHLYQMLIHSPPVAEGWLAFLTAIRQKSGLDGCLRELLIVRIAQFNKAPYEADQHIPIALAEGASQAQIDALANWQDSPLFTAEQRVALAYAEAMTRQVQVPADVFAEVRAAFDDRALVELTATIGAYNMVSRFLEALEVHSHDPR
ncbi:carboxymuconolactone decarboxylase family protein [Stappia taiwanensis]|uniref:Carboxymuconolactone decarboxylase family protein n=1 Tax=Stappia taiwanensis TaxID=992267 RepID=A0A838XT86_9HYPH|nr:carboxymuconolactone decarboxylase family protein [Stappia taiwanensis]MBA4613602.1 carboxymuconolactone decarboxylase family protein [Stappia taiwanensis]GGE98869.1 carboxymuconolactone decarboxylase [Stappia taiwanensis]